MVDHFKILRLIGAGGFAEVYLARDMLLGRKVALKLISAANLGTTAAKQFVFEARATARFNHPHIVAIHGVGEHLGRPYVALEYLEGQTLRERMLERPLSLRECLRFALPIAEALTEAHRRGVIHRDLKPENVLIPADGRLRLLDFGLATRVGKGALQARPSRPTLEDRAAVDGETLDLASDATPRAASGAQELRGTPDYMAPEQWLQHERGGATDIWALGVILYEMIVGRTPYDELPIPQLATTVVDPREPAPEIPPAMPVSAELRQLVADCLQKDPQNRPSADELLARLERSIYRRRSFLDEGDSPFRGLLPFTERYADFFFGRDAEIGAFVERVRHDPVLPVVGPSGAGKSSFVDAGVLPRLKEQGPWTVVRLRPGARPFSTLAARLLALKPDLLQATGERPQRGPGFPGERQTTGPQAPPPRDELRRLEVKLCERLLRTPSLLALALDEIGEHRQSNVLLFVDQLEELYTLVDEPARRRRFMEALCGAADDPAGPLRVIFTLRDDFLGRLAEGSGVAEALGHVTVLRSPKHDELREILTKPPHAVGYGYDDPTLVDEMLDAVRGEPACLPLLQFATRTLWDRRDTDKRLLLRSVYEQIGGVAGALAEHADSVLSGLSAQQVEVVREVLLRLVTADGTRRAMSRTQAVEGLGEEGERLVDRLIQARLLSIARQNKAEEQTEAELELVHESLIGRWQRLTRWIDESRDDLALLEELRQAAELWHKRGCRQAELWRGRALREAERIVERGTTLVPSQAREFIEAGRRQAEQRRRSRQRMQVLGVGALALVALGALIIAWAYASKEREALRQRDAADAARVRARRRAADSQRAAAGAALMRGKLLEARARLRSALELQDSSGARAIWARLSRRLLLWQREFGGSVFDVALSPDGRTAAVACQDKTIYLLDLRTHQLRFLRGHGDQVYSVAFAPDGTRLASGTWSGEVGLWNLRDGAFRVRTAHRGKVYRVAFAPDGRTFASASYDKTVRLWDGRDGKPLRTFDSHRARVRALAFSPDGGWIAAAGQQGVIRLHRVDGSRERSLAGHDGPVMGLAFAPDGALLASGGAEGTIRLWRVADGSLAAKLGGHNGTVDSVAFSHDGALLASGGHDRLVRLWNPTSGVQLMRLPGHRARVQRVAFAGAHGRRLISASLDRTLRLWRSDPRRPPERLPPGHRDRVFGVAVSPGGARAATGSWDTTVRLWDLRTGAQQRVLRGHRAAVFSVDFSPDGKRLASGAWDKTARVWPLRSAGDPLVLRGHRSEVSAVDFSPDGRRLATASWDRSVRIWNAETGRPLLRLGPHSAPVYDIDHDRTGRRLVVGAADGKITVWDLARRRRLHQLDAGAAVFGVSFSPDGRRIAVGSSDGKVNIWRLDAPDRAPRTLGRHRGRVYHLSFSPDGALVGSPSSDGSARLWRVDGGPSVELAGHRGEVNFLRFTPDGGRVVTTSHDGTIRSWRIDGMPAWRATLLLPAAAQLLTHRGWLDLTAAGATRRRGERWARAAVARARLAVAGARSVAFVAADGQLELWDRRRDRRRYRRPVGAASELALLGDEVVAVLVGGRLSLQRPGARPELLADDVSAIGTAEGGALLMARHKQIVLRLLDGTSQRFATDADVSAIACNTKELLVGYEDGHVELIDRASERRKALALDAVPAAAALRLRFGPRQTVIAGHADGGVGVWDRTNGERLLHGQVHGPLRYVYRRGSSLHAISALGDHQTLDLELLTSDYCALLRQIWREVPLVWDGGAPVLRAPPTDHRCRQRAQRQQRFTSGGSR